jgi:hypothetical protein
MSNLPGVKLGGKRGKVNKWAVVGRPKEPKMAGDWLFAGQWAA